MSAPYEDLPSHASLRREAHFKENKPGVWLVDIDGTVALMDGRGPFDWHRVYEDKPNHDVIRVIRILAQMTQMRSDDNLPSIMFLSGRLETCRLDTERWLRENVWSYWRALHMRPEVDQYMPDQQLKRRIYREEIEPNYQVLGVFDDRRKVVDMWRAMGLTVFHTAAGEF